VPLPVGWHLNIERVHVLPIPKKGALLRAEIRCRINILPEAQRYEPKYQSESSSAYHGMIQLWQAYGGMPQYPTNKDKDDNEDEIDLDFDDDDCQPQEDVVVKQEADAAGQLS
jgi:hypothetical protein